MGNHGKGKTQKQKLEVEAGKPQEMLRVPSRQSLLEASKVEALLQPSEESARESSKLKEYEEMLKRLQADFENYKKRVEKENEQKAFFEGEELMLNLLPFLDDVDAALEAAEKSGDAKLRDNVIALRTKLFTVLGKAGLSEMKCEGEMFDPYKHEAVLHEASEKKEGEIVRIVRKGYLFRGKILRHAFVSVSNGEKPESTEVLA